MLTGTNISPVADSLVEDLESDRPFQWAEETLARKPSRLSCLQSHIC